MSENGKKVYIVIGHSGEHDSYEHWIVKGFFDKDLADDHRINCKAEASRIKDIVTELDVEAGLKESKEIYGYHFVDPEMMKMEPLIYWERFSEIIDPKNNKFDDSFQFDREYMDYTVEEVDIYDNDN